MGDARGLLFYESGIAAKKLEVLPDNRVKARLALAGDCPLGSHALRMQTATGISNLVTFSVGALAEADEIKPDNDFAKPQKINLNTTVNGVVRNEDVDYFAVEAKKGQRLSAEWKACGWARRSSIRTWRSWTPGGSCWPRPTIRLCCDKTAPVRSSCRGTAPT